MEPCAPVAHRELVERTGIAPQFGRHASEAPAVLLPAVPHQGPVAKYPHGGLQLAAGDKSLAGCPSRIFALQSFGAKKGRGRKTSDRFGRAWPSGQSQKRRGFRPSLG